MNYIFKENQCLHVYSRAQCTSYTAREISWKTFITKCCTSPRSTTPTSTDHSLHPHGCIVYINLFLHLYTKLVVQLAQSNVSISWNRILATPRCYAIRVKAGKYMFWECNPNTHSNDASTRTDVTGGQWWQVGSPAYNLLTRKCCSS